MTSGDIIDGRHFPARDADFSLAQFVERLFFGFVLIIAWKIFDQIAERRDAQGAQGLRTGRADFMQIVDRKAERFLLCDPVPHYSRPIFLCLLRDLRAFAVDLDLDYREGAKDAKDRKT